MEITLKINKSDVMQEVAVATSYTGVKMEGDEKAAERIPTIDEDEKHLERFWEECRADLCQELIGLVTYEGMGTIAVAPLAQSTADSLPKPHYELRLEVSKSFDDALLPSMKLSLFSYFVMGIVAKWYVYTNKKEAGEYADKAATLLDDIHRKAVFKKKPKRPTYDD